MKKLYIIVLNFNGGKEVADCLKNVERSQKPKGWVVNVLLVDNNSSDNSVQTIKKRFKKVILIKNRENLGFAGGNNIGIKYALGKGAEAVLLLNQDTLVGKGFLASLLSHQADIVSPVVKFKRKGDWRYDFGGRVNWTLGRTFHLETAYLQKPPHQHPDYLSGCAMLVKRKVFEKIGLLDERFFLYFEDVDFCLRAKKAGFEIKVEPKSIVEHKLAEGKKKPIRQRLHLLKSNFLFINKHLKFWQRPMAYCYLLVLALNLLL